MRHRPTAADHDPGGGLFVHIPERTIPGRG